MPNRIYLWEIGEKLLNNPLEDTNYLNILWLLPTLGTEIKKRVADLLTKKYNILHKNDLNSNIWLPHQDILSGVQSKIIQNLFELEKLTGESKNIVIFADDCFTNTLLVKLFVKILWEKNFERFVSVRTLDLSKPSNEDLFKVNSNSLLFFGGSLQDTDRIDKKYYSWSFSELIKNLWDDFCPPEINNRAVWICFWHQLFSNFLWIKNSHASSVIATYRWLAQFWPSVCSLQNYKYMSSIYQEALLGLSNYGSNNEFSTFFTRTGYVDEDVLKTWHASTLKPLIRDKITGTPVSFGTQSRKILTAQFHPEISYFDDRKFLQNNIEAIIPYLAQYKNHEKLIENFNFETWFQDIIQQDIGEAFYTFVIWAFIKSIKESYIQLHKKNSKVKNIEKNISYESLSQEIIKEVRKKIDSKLAMTNPILNDKKESVSFLKKSSECWLVRLNDKPDWSVNRWIEKVSDVYGIQDVWKLLEAQIDFLKLHFPKKEVYFFRDWWAGDGSLLKDLYSKYKGKNILFYWVWDYIYFDIYPSLKSQWLKMWIPEDVIILLFEEFLENYKNMSWLDVFVNIKNALKQAQLNHIHKIHISSITWNNTVMFSWEWEYDMSSDSVQYIQKNPIQIEKLKKYIIDNLFFLLEWYFERIYISKFIDFNLDTSHIWKIDFQTAVRSTSHVWPREFQKIIYDYVTKSANPWSINLENWLTQSYTWVVRLPEMKRLSEMFTDTKISLIYDENTNYFTTIIIEKIPYHDESFFSHTLQPWYTIVSLEEANNSTFFKLDYFIRNFIMNNFKNYNVFWNFNKEIWAAEKEIMELLIEKNITPVKNIILNLINFIASHYKNDNIIYDIINMDILTKYSIGNESLETIISSEIYIPEWMNLSGKRKY